MAMLVGPVTFRLTNARPLLLLAWATLATPPSTLLRQPCHLWALLLLLCLGRIEKAPQHEHTLPHSHVLSEISIAPISLIFI